MIPAARRFIWACDGRVAGMTMDPFAFFIVHFKDERSIIYPVANATRASTESKDAAAENTIVAGV
jgi:hypothetical protein